MVKGVTGKYLKIFFFKLILEREGERGINWLFHLFMHSVVACMCPDRTEIEPTILAYRDNALTN